MRCSLAGKLSPSAAPSLLPHTQADKPKKPAKAKKPGPIINCPHILPRFGHLGGLSQNRCFSTPPHHGKARVPAHCWTQAFRTDMPLSPAALHLFASQPLSAVVSPGTPPYLPKPPHPQSALSLAVICRTRSRCQVLVPASSPPATGTFQQACSGRGGRQAGLMWLLTTCGQSRQAH